MEPAGVGLQKIFRDLLARAPAAEAPLLAWPVICGHGVANRSRALDFSDGVLRVEVPDRPWMTQLAELAPRYVAAFAQVIGPAVRRIEFVVAGERQANKP